MLGPEHVQIIQTEASRLAAEQGVVAAPALVDAVRAAFGVAGLAYETFSANDLLPHLPPGVHHAGFERGWSVE